MKFKWSDILDVIYLSCEIQKIRSFEIVLPNLRPFYILLYQSNIILPFHLVLHCFAWKVIKDKVQKRKQQTEVTTPKKRRSFIDILIENYERGEIDMDGLREEVDTFMFEVGIGLAFRIQHRFNCVRAS